MDLVDPVSGKVVWSDKSGMPMPPPPAGGKWVERGSWGPAPKRQPDPSTMDMILNGTGITERVNTLNELFNPMVAMHDAGKASQKMLDPNTSGWGRVGAFGEMAGNMASVLAPVAGAKLAGGGAEKVAKALTDSLTGIPLPDGEIGRFMADEFGGIKLYGGDDADFTNTGWVFRDLKKPVLSSAENKKYNEAGMMGKVEIVPIKKMYATQPRVNPDYAYTETSAGQLPKVIRKDGEFFVMDGHHRLTKLADEGGQNARVELFDMDQSDTSMPLLDYDAKRAAAAKDEIAKLLAELGL